LARRDRLDQLLGEQTQADRWASLIGRLRCLRGVDTLTAVGLLVEIGDFTAFTHPRQLTSYLGLVPSEASTGERRRQRSITKAGSSAPADYSSKPPGTTDANPQSRSNCAAASQDSRPPRSKPPGGRSYVCTAGGRAWTDCAASGGPRQPENRTTAGTTRATGFVAADSWLGSACEDPPRQAEPATRSARTWKRSVLTCGGPSGLRAFARSACGAPGAS
jgi:hypothetical protein